MNGDHLGWTTRLAIATGAIQAVMRRRACFRRWPRSRVESDWSLAMESSALAVTRTRAHGISRVAVLVLGFLSVTPALAGDLCIHPRTPVEVTICTHPRLRALEATLNKVYRQALAEAADPALIKKAQRNWHAQRDTFTPTDVAGLKSIYHQQIEYLNCLPYHIRANAPPVPPAVVPAYPDRWGYAPPAGDWIRGTVLLPDGDVGLGLFDAKTKRTVYRRLFFHRPLTQENVCRIYANAGGPLSFRAKLADGHTVTSGGADNWMGTAHCYAGPGDYLEIRSATAGTPIKNTFLYVLDKPEHVVNGRFCDGNPSQRFTLRVISLPMFQFLPLPDGTFWVTNLGGPGIRGIPRFLIRLNDRLQTRSPILKGRLFIVDTAKLKRWLYRADFRDDALMQRGLLRWLTVKKQGRR